MILLMKGEVIAVKWKDDYIPLIKTKLTKKLLGSEDPSNVI